MIKIRLLPSVLDDTAQAAQWYDEEGHAGLGERFLGVFYSYLTHIKEHGEIYKTVYSDFRRILLNPFPYAVYYSYHEDSVVVSLVIHTARNPRLLRKLLKERRLKS